MSDTMTTDSQAVTSGTVAASTNPAPAINVAPAPQRPFEEVVLTLNDATALAYRVRDMATKLSGFAPAAPQPGSAAKPVGIVNEMAELASTTADLITDAQAALDQLTGLLL